MDDIVTVVAIYKGTGFIETVTSCDAKDAEKYAKYYRSIGYKARIVDDATLHEMLEKEKQERRMNYGS